MYYRIKKYLVVPFCWKIDLGINMVTLNLIFLLCLIRSLIGSGEIEVYIT